MLEKCVLTKSKDSYYNLTNYKRKHKKCKKKTRKRV